MKSFKNQYTAKIADATEWDAGDQEITYCVRDGIDEQDVCSYMLKKTLTPGDLEIYDLIHVLFLLRIYWAPQYEYELHIYRTPEDEWLLSHFNYF